jgi:GxxExxY protein
MDELLYKEEVFQLVGLCMEIHCELGKGHDEIIYKDALVVELRRAGIPFLREKNYEIIYKGVILRHYYYADFVVWDKILFEAKAVEKLTDSHVKQVLNYLAASKFRLALWSISVAIRWSGNEWCYETRTETDTTFTNLREWRQQQTRITRICTNQFQGRNGPADILSQLRENSCNSCPVSPQNS